MGPPAAAIQQSFGVNFPFRKLHELYYPLIAGHLDVPAQQNIGRPHHGIKPVQAQGQKSDHLDPVVSLVQVGPLVIQDIAAGLGLHSHRYVDSGLDKSQNEGRFNSFGFPSPGDFHRIPYPASQGKITVNTVAQENHRYSSPQVGHQSRQINCLARNAGLPFLGS